MTETEPANFAVAQGVGSYVEYLRTLRLSELMTNLDSILVSETGQLADIAARQAKAQGHLDLAGMRVQNLIDTNRGGATGVHGFIAEEATAGVRNAQRAMDGIRKSVTVLNDNGPHDLIVGRHNVQVKFYNDPLRQLQTSANYPDATMLFAKDHVEAYQQISAGQTNVTFNGNPLTERQISSVRRQLNEIDQIRGTNSWMESSDLTYSEVQRDNIAHRLETESQSISDRAASERKSAEAEANKKRVEAHNAAKPSIGEAGKVAASAAAVQGGISFLAYVYSQHRAGKPIWKFDSENWKEAGLQAVKGGATGAVTGVSIYGLTNILQMSAPSAAAFTAGTFGVASAVAQYRQGKIDDDQFNDLLLFNALESTGSAIGAAVGQALIPIPVLGAVIGSIASSMILRLGKAIFSKHEEKVIRRQEAKMDAYIKSLDEDLQKAIKEIYEKFAAIRDWQVLAFDVELNVEQRLYASVELARMLGVDEDKILVTLEDADAYFLGATSTNELVGEVASPRIVM